MEEQPDYSYVLNLISQCDDVRKLTTFIINAQKKQVSLVRDAAYNRLKSFIPKTNIKGIDQDFWTMFSAYEDLLLEYSRPTLKLNNARDRMLREGPRQAIDFWVTHKDQRWAFEYFIKNDKQSLTAENLVLQYKDLFDARLYALAQDRVYMATRKILEIA